MSAERDRLLDMIDSLTAERNRYRFALEKIINHLELPCERKDDGILIDIAREALK